MNGPTRLVIAIALFTGATASAQRTPVAAAARAGNGVFKLPTPAKLHINSFTIVSPACGKPIDFKVDVQNLSSGAFAGSTNISNRPGAVLTITQTTTNKVVMFALGSVGGGGTLSIPISVPGFVAACPGQACYEVALLVLQPDSTTVNLPEWDGVKGSVCIKQTCDIQMTGPLVRSL